MPLARRETLLPEAPTLFLLHGWGSDADDLHALAGPLALPFSIVSLQAPDRHPSGSGWSWFDIGWTERGLSLDSELARERAAQLAETFAGYPRPWTVVGFSQGAMMGGLLLSENPEAVDAAVLIAGMLLPGVEVKGGTRRRVLVTHGRTDPVVPFSEGERLARELGSVHDVRFLPDPGAHSVSPAQIAGIRSFLDE